MKTRTKPSIKTVHDPKLRFHPLTPARWKDLEKLFGPRGACAGCWCMWWRLTRSQFARQQGAKNKTALKRIISSGQIPGILAYADGAPVGWCAVEPRENYPSLERSRKLARIDDKSVWSVTCFFVAREFRRRGVTVQLLRAAIDYVRKRGGKIVEGYPTEPKKGKIPDVFVYTGLATAFRKAGFKECLRRSARRPIMRCTIK